MSLTRPDIEGASQVDAVFLPHLEEIQFSPELTSEQLGQLIFQQSKKLSLDLSMAQMDFFGPAPVQIAEVLLNDAPPVQDHDPRYRTHRLLLRAPIGGSSVEWQLHKLVANDDGQPRLSSVMHLRIDAQGLIEGWQADYDTQGQRWFSRRLEEKYAASEQPRYYLMLWGQIQRVLGDPQALSQIEAAQQSQRLEDHIGQLLLERILAQRLNGQAAAERARIDRELAATELALKAARFAVSAFVQEPADIDQPVSQRIRANDHVIQQVAYEKYRKAGQLSLLEDMQDLTTY